MPGSDLTATHARYATLDRAMEILARRIAEAKVLHAEKGHGDDEGQALDSAIEAALMAAILAAELDGNATEDAGRLYARVVVATKAAEVAAGAIYAPMDAPVARVRCAADLLCAAMEDFVRGERRVRP